MFHGATGTGLSMREETAESSTPLRRLPTIEAHGGEHAHPHDDPCEFPAFMRSSASVARVLIPYSNGVGFVNREMKSD